MAGTARGRNNLGVRAPARRHRAQGKQERGVSHEQAKHHHIRGVPINATSSKVETTIKRHAPALHGKLTLLRLTCLDALPLRRYAAAVLNRGKVRRHSLGAPLSVGRQRCQSWHPPPLTRSRCPRSLHPNLRCRIKPQSATAGPEFRVCRGRAQAQAAASPPCPVAPEGHCLKATGSGNPPARNPQKSSKAYARWQPCLFSLSVPSHRPILR